MIQNRVLEIDNWVSRAEPGRSSQACGSGCGAAAPATTTSSVTPAACPAPTARCWRARSQACPEIPTPSGGRITAVRNLFTKLHPGAAEFMDEQIGAVAARSIRRFTSSTPTSPPARSKPRRPNPTSSSRCGIRASGPRRRTNELPEASGAGRRAGRRVRLGKQGVPGSATRPPGRSMAVHSRFRQNSHKNLTPRRIPLSF